MSFAEPLFGDPLVADVPEVGVRVTPKPPRRQRDNNDRDPKEKPERIHQQDPVPLIGTSVEDA